MPAKCSNCIGIDFTYSIISPIKIIFRAPVIVSLSPALFQWNQTIELFREGMPLRRHRSLFKNYECCFKASEAVDWLHKLLRCNQNFGPEVTRNQTIQLLKKFLKNRVIEDIKGRWGKEDFEDDSHLYR